MSAFINTKKKTLNSKIGQSFNSLLIMTIVLNKKAKISSFVLEDGFNSFIIASIDCFNLKRSSVLLTMREFFLYVYKISISLKMNHYFNNYKFH